MCLHAVESDYPQDVNDFLKSEFGQKVMQCIMKEAEDMVRTGYEEAYKMMSDLTKEMKEMEDTHQKEIMRLNQISEQGYIQSLQVVNDLRDRMTTMTEKTDKNFEDLKRELLRQSNENNL